MTQSHSTTEIFPAQVAEPAGFEHVETGLPEAPDQTFEYRHLKEPLTRLKYVQLTSELIDKVITKKTDTLIFLDKSARPVYWLMKELWPLLASSHDVENEQVQTPAMPEVKFLNIDRGMWIKNTGSVEDDTGVGVKVNESTVGHDIVDLRAAFMSRREDIAKIGGEQERPATLDGKKIMIVDEVRVSGNTLEIARQFLEKAFPTAEVEGEHWMHPMIESRGGTRFNSEIPVWYSDVTALGRGIGDLNVAANEQSEHMRLKRGKKFFSRPLGKPDEMSDDLRQEMSQLVDEISSGQLPLRLNLAGLDEKIVNDRIKFMEAVNYGVDPRLLTQLLQQSQGNSSKFLKLYNAAKK